MADGDRLTLLQLQLFEAVKNGNAGNVRKFLDAGAGRLDRIVNARDEQDNMPLLHHATLNSETETRILKWLLLTKEMDLKAECDGSLTSLHIAVYCGNEEAVELLLDQISSREIGLTACTYHNLTVLHMAAKSGNPEVCKLLLSVEEVSSLINARDRHDWTSLHHAAWEGHERFVENLLTCPTVEVNAKNADGYTPLHLAAWNNHPGVVDLLLHHRKIQPQATSEGGVHDLIRGDRDTIVERLRAQEKFPFAHPRRNRSSLEGFVHENPVDAETRYRLFLRKHVIDRNLLGSHERNMFRRNKRLSNMLTCGNKRITALHCAAYGGHSDVVQCFVKSAPKPFRMLNTADGHLMTPLHYASLLGHVSVVEALLASPVVRVNQEEKSTQRTAFQIALEKGCGTGAILKKLRPPLDNYDEWRYEEIEMLLSQRSDVKDYVESLYRDRQLYVDATNAILVGASVIASVTFAGWLQPPLGYTTYYETKYLLPDPAPADTYQDFAAVNHKSVKVFWIFNCLSFFFAIATVVTGAGIVLPVGDVFIREEVRMMRRTLLSVSLLLTNSIMSVLAAFTGAGFAVLPPEIKYRWPMVFTAALGVYQCSVILLWFFIRLGRIPGILEIVRENIVIFRG